VVCLNIAQYSDKDVIFQEKFLEKGVKADTQKQLKYIS